MGSSFSRLSEGTDYRQDRALENRGESSRSFNPFKRASEINKFREEANTILTKMPESEDVIYAGCLLHRREMLKLMKKIVDSRKSSYKDIFKEIFKDMDENSEKMKDGLYKSVAEDLRDCIQCTSVVNLKDIIKGKLEENDEDLYTHFLGKMEKYKVMLKNILSKSSILEELFKYNNLLMRLKKYISKKELNDMQYGIMKEYYKLGDDITRLRNEIGLIHDDGFSQIIEWGVRDLEKIILEDIPKAKWYQDYQKNLENRLKSYWETLNNLAKLTDNSSEIENCMESIASLEKKLDEDEQRYSFDPGVVEWCAEYRKAIKHFRVHLGKRFWEDEV
jgi:hypothetical protein